MFVFLLWIFLLISFTERRSEMAADNIETSFDGNSPAENIDTKSKHRELEDGVALCLSGE
jgi:hypothetical protein